MGCVFQDVEPPRTSSILRKSSTTTKPIRCVRFSTGVLRNAKLRDQNPSLNRQLSDARQLGCVFQDMTPPKSILRKSTDMPKAIQRVKLKKAIARHTKIRDQNPSLGYICPGEPHQRSPNAPKFEDRSQEETVWHEHWAREPAWKLAKKILKLKEKHKAAFFSPTEKWCLHSPSKIKLEEREFVVDSGASMHMISRKDMNSAELETVRISRCPTSLITANGEVQTHAEETVYVKELDIFLDYESPRKHASSVIARKALRGSRIFI